MVRATLGVKSHILPHRHFFFLLWRKPGLFLYKKDQNESYPRLALADNHSPRTPAAVDFSNKLLCDCGRFSKLPW